MSDPQPPAQPQHPELQAGPDDEDARLRRTQRRRGIWIAVVATVVAVALLGYGLVPLFAAPREPDSVRPGPLPAQPEATLEAFGAQQPVWRSCGGQLECADVHAPLDWGDLGRDTITLRLVKQPAASGEPVGTLFVNPGGPGASGVEWVLQGLGSISPEVRQQYDVVGWDPRGVGASTPVTCFDTEGMDRFLYGDPDEVDDEPERGSDEWFALAAEETAEMGEACIEQSGDVVGFVDTVSTVRDLDMLRSIVGDEKLHYLGFSYGTYIGALYADLFPGTAGRLVLDGAMNPETTQAEVVRAQTVGFENALRAYAADCIGRDDCPLSGSVDDAMAQVRALLDRVERQPIPADDGRVLHEGTLLTAIIFPLYFQGNWWLLDQLFAELPEGDPTTAFWLADMYNGRENGRYLDNSMEAFTAINCLDYPIDDDYDRIRAEAVELDRLAPTIGKFQGYGGGGCQGWPFEPVEYRGAVTGEGADPLLVIGTTGDPATPYEWAVELSQQLQSARLVTLEGEGHTAYGKNACVNAVVDDYLLNGAVPESDPACA